MTTTDHPLTEAAAAELWDAHREPGVVPLSEQGRAYARNQTVLFRAAFDAGREHEREHTDPHHDPRPWQDCTRKDIRKGDLVEARRGDSLIVGVAHDQNGHGDWWAEDGWHLTWDDRWPLRRIPASAPEKDAPMTETTPAVVPSEPLARTLLGVPDTHGAPHHDADRIKQDDFVADVDKDGTIRSGLAHHQDGDGDWENKDRFIVTYAARRADRPDAITVWPAPTPPAEEITLPTEHPAHLTDVETEYCARCAYMALDRDGDWCGVDRQGVLRDWVPRDITAFTLPDGTRARRDGEHADGTPRFVKVREEEK